MPGPLNLKNVACIIVIKRKLDLQGRNQTFESKCEILSSCALVDIFPCSLLLQFRNLTHF